VQFAPNTKLGGDTDKDLKRPRSKNKRDPGAEGDKSVPKSEKTGKSSKTPFIP